ncbi:DUF6010 family protein [Telluribacter humicola]|uniref:DUF6010 family protein n=1 Tax=Telluribacter humicola TaxID=1720261 RepID=UPI001A972143|nr:DUF6010 family protein [Telluribacter humicola]
METYNHVVPEFTLVNALAAVLIAFVFIALMSLVKEPGRQKINAILIAGAGGVYWSGGLGIWEFMFGTVMLFVAYKGLQHYYFIGIGWLLHTIWDILHHFYGDPIVYLEPSSSAGCAVCDPILAIWFFFGAPSVWNLIRKQKIITT